MDGGAWWAAVHGVLKSRTQLSDFTFTFHFSCIGGNGNPLQCSCLENPRDGGAWWAAIYGVAQSRTRLKRFSSSSSSSIFKCNENNESVCCINSEAQRLICFLKKLLHYDSSPVPPFILSSTRHVPTMYWKPRKQLGNQECVINISSVNEWIFSVWVPGNLDL